jgi:hypothetical protein
MRHKIWKAMIWATVIIDVAIAEWRLRRQRR